MLEQGYNPKDLSFDKDGRNELLEGVSTMAKAVKSTLGPGGNTVIIESPFHTKSLTVTKDGVTVAKNVDLLDPVQNIAVRMLKEAALNTATIAGDGTTTSIVLAESLLKNGVKALESDKSISRTDIVRDLNKLLGVSTKILDKWSKKITKKRLLDVATISANNDKDLGKLIAQTYHSVGKDGIVTVENSQTHETYNSITHGIKVDRGYSSPVFVNNQRKDECILEDTYVLVSDAEISRVFQIERVLKQIINENDKLLIIAPCSTNFINTLGANVVKSGLKVCIIQPPDFGYRSTELMQDIAVSVGAKFFSEKTGDNLDLIQMEDLGFVKRAIVGSKDTILIRSEQCDNTESIEDRVSELYEALEITPGKVNKDFILRRIAGLKGGIGVIYAGGNSDIEQKEKFDRIDDAVCAVRSALEEGILPGGGIALYNLSKELEKNTSGVSLVALGIFLQMLEEPIKQILRNSGHAVDAVLDLVDGCLDVNHGFNAKTTELGDMYRMGIVDPLKVTKSALTNAVSVASTMLSTNAIITLKRA